MILDDVKVLLNISDIIKDDTLNIYIRKATNLIKEYINNPAVYTYDYIQANYADAVIDLVVNAYIFKDKQNIRSITQGSRMITYTDNTAFAINDNIAKMLPKPFISMK